MTCADLAARIQAMQPAASSHEVARLCLLMCNAVADLNELDQPGRFNQAWRDVALKLNAATDQHAAMTEELEMLASSNPDDLSRDKVWVLVRALKVQSQVLQLYVGESAVV